MLSILRRLFAVEANPPHRSGPATSEPKLNPSHGNLRQGAGAITSSGAAAGATRDPNNSTSAIGTSAERGNQGASLQDARWHDIDLLIKFLRGRVDVPDRSALRGQLFMDLQKVGPILHSVIRRLLRNLSVAEREAQFVGPVWPKPTFGSDLKCSATLAKMRST